MISPTDALPDDDVPLTPQQVSSWRDQGFVLVQGLVPEELVSAAQEEMAATPPGPLTRGLMLPSSSDALNKISTHRRPRSAVRQLLGTGSLTLLQSEAWSKVAATFGGRYDNQDQRMHVTRADAQTTASAQRKKAAWSASSRASFRELNSM